MDFADVSVHVRKSEKEVVLKIRERVIKVFHTHCVLELLCENEWVEIGRGCSKQDPRDVYNKRTGKKNALKYAMEAANMNDKDERNLVWDRFVAVYGDYR